MTQHVKTTLHVERKKMFEVSKIKQQTIHESVASTSTKDEQFQFNFDLCKMMIQSNIPLKKLEKGPLQEFLEKHCNRHIPVESTLRKNYVGPVFQQVYNEIKHRIGDNYLWFAVDETTDSCGRYVASLIVGILNENFPSRGYVVSLKMLDKTNGNTITRFVNDSLTSLFLPNAVPANKILLMISDAARYMLKAGNNLKILYPNLIHSTCIAHGLNRVAEGIRLQFPTVNKLVANGKKIFVKAPLRVQHFKEKFPNIPLPPEPIITRWGTWLQATFYYDKYIKEFEEVVTEFSEDSSQSIKDCINILENKDLRQDLAFLRSNYQFVCEVIEKLEKPNMLLVDAINLVKEFKQQANAVRGDIGTRVSQKLDEVLNKNAGFGVLSDVARVLQGQKVENLELDSTLVAKFKFAPTTSVDVERTFSNFKHILNDRRKNFTVDNLEHITIINCFKEN